MSDLMSDLSDRLVGTIAKITVRMVGRARFERATNWLKANTINDINQRVTEF